MCSRKHKPFSILFAVVCAVLYSTPAASTPFGVELRSHQFNLCDARCSKPNPPENLVIYMMAAESPHTVSLNEICFASASTIAASRGVSVAVYQATTTPNCPISFTGYRAFGNGAIVAGSPSPPRYLRWAFPIPRFADSI